MLSNHPPSHVLTTFGIVLLHTALLRRRRGVILISSETLDRPSSITAQKRFYRDSAPADLPQLESPLVSSMLPHVSDPEVNEIPLTLHDVNNATVRALFTIQNKFKLFGAGDTVIDIGCLPGTSSRCIRQWIDSKDFTPDEPLRKNQQSQENSHSLKKVPQQGNNVNIKNGFILKRVPSEKTKAKRNAETVDDDIDAILNKIDQMPAQNPPHWRDQFAKRSPERRMETKIYDETTAGGPPSSTRHPEKKGFIIGIDAFKVSEERDRHVYYVGDMLINKTVQELSTDPLALEQATGNILKIGPTNACTTTSTSTTHAASLNDTFPTNPRDQGKVDIIFIDLCPLLEKELNEAAVQLLSFAGPQDEKTDNNEGDSLNMNHERVEFVQRTLSKYHPSRHPQYYTRLSQEMIRENQLAAETTKLRRQMRKEAALQDPSAIAPLPPTTNDKYELLATNTALTTSGSEILNHRSSEFFNVADNATAFESFLESFKPNHKSARKQMLRDDTGTSKIVIKKAGGRGEVYVVKDDSSASAGSDVGISHRINFFNFPEILTESQNKDLAMFRPTPLSVDTLFLTALESTATAVRLMKPYLKPFRELDRTSSPVSMDEQKNRTNAQKKWHPHTTAGKILIRLVIPSEALISTPSTIGGNKVLNSNQIAPGDAPVLASETRNHGNDVATVLGSVSGAYHAFIESLEHHFSHVEVIDHRKIEIDDEFRANITNVQGNGAIPVDNFSRYTQLMVLAHNGDTPLVSSEQTSAPRSIKDNPAFVLFDREIIMKSENENSNKGSEEGGNRKLRAHSLKYDLPSQGVVLPTGDGLGHNSKVSQTHGNQTSKPKFRGVYKYFSETASVTGVNLSPNASKIKMRHTKWSPNRGFSHNMSNAPSSNSVSAVREAFKANQAVSGQQNPHLSPQRDKFSSLTALSSSSQLRPANLAIVGQGVAEASTKGYQSKIATSRGETKISIGTGTVIGNPKQGNSSTKSIGTAKSQFFKSRYPALLQAPPPAEELRLRLKKEKRAEIAREQAQQRFNEYKMKSIDDGDMIRDINDI